MKACITVNDVLRRHYKTFTEVYEVYSEEEEMSTIDYQNSNYEFGELNSNAEFDNVDVEFSELNEIKTEKKILNLDGLVDPMYITSKFEFEDESKFVDFLHFDLAFEIFAKTTATYPNVMLEFLMLQEYFQNKNITLDVVSQQISNSKAATLFFLSREKCKLNNLKFVPNYQNIWRDYQIVITAENYLIETKTSRRKLFQIETENNKHLNRGVKVQTLKEILDYLNK